MTRDVPPAPSDPLKELGWRPFFAQQTVGDDLTATPPVRVTAVHRSGLHLRGDGIETVIQPRADATVGDWLLLNAAQPAQSRLLARQSLIQRKAAGDDRQQQLIAANVDSCFIVTSCNDEFNLARLERFIALVFEAAVTPVILLTKADLTDDPAPFVAAARSISDRIEIVVMNALGDQVTTQLQPWCGPGQTIAFLGSSGVGKSTLVNALLGGGMLATAPVRGDDAKGRHTTRHRELHFMSNHCALMDMPGMRELQLADAEEGVEEVFADLAELATNCRFSDCRHETEPGCAIRAALAKGAFDEARLARWAKLVAEEQSNSAAMAKRKTFSKVLGKTIRAGHKRSKT